MFTGLDDIRQEGHYCGRHGLLGRDANPYRRHDRRTARLQGWENGRAEKDEEDALAAADPMSAEEMANNHKRCQTLLAALKGGDAA